MGFWGVSPQAEKQNRWRLKLNVSSNDFRRNQRGIDGSTIPSLSFRVGTPMLKLRLFLQ